MSFTVSAKRIYLILGIFAILLLVILARLFVLQIIDADAKTKEAIASRTVSYDTKPIRGSIYDRNGNVLAYSEKACTIVSNPSEIKNDNYVAEILVKHLGGNKSDYIEKIENKKLKFSYIKRRVDIEKAEALEDEGIVGLYFKDDQKRVYPYGQIGGQIIGAINIDGDGLCGLEYYYDDLLRGYSGSTVRQQGNQGMPIPGGVMQDKPVVDGQDIMISIDIELQQRLEDILQNWNTKIGTPSMHSIIMDPTNGEIYAAASLPLLNPSDLANAKEGATDLKSISTTYEPGSTFKSVAAMAILENNVLTPDSQIFCPSQLKADEYVIKDAKPRDSVTYTFRQIMEKSSNIGISLANEKLGWDKYYNKLETYGVNEQTGIDYPGDSQGYILDFNRWSKIQAYNISFGQGITMTPLQTSKFYCAIANNGVEETPHFLIRYLQNDSDETYDNKEIFTNKEAVNTMVDILQSVVTNGTGKNAEIEGYGVAGKTGTGEIATESGSYLNDCFYSSFVGYLSKANIPMLCFVGAEKAPTDTSVTAVWKDIMNVVIERLKIAQKN